MLVAVCRGKLCEGIDFTDRQCRLVIMIGVPYPAKNDLRVMLKQDFLERGMRGEGRKWYVREAIRAVNQTVGRVIRHKDDFGGVLLCDDRYAKDNRLAPFALGLPSWLRAQIFVRNSCANSLETCRRFFESHVGSLPGPSSVPPPAVTPPSAQTQDKNLEAPRTTSALRPVPQSTSAASASVLRGLVTGKGATPAGLVPYSALAGVLKERRRAAAAAAAAQQLQVSSNEASQSSTLTRGCPKFRGPATPHVSSPAAGTAQVTGADHANPFRKRPAPTAQVPLQQKASGAEQYSANPFRRETVQVAPRQAAPVGPKATLQVASSRSSYMEGPVAERWLKTAKDLLPRMEFDDMMKFLKSVQEQAVSIMADSIRTVDSSHDLETRLLASMKAVAEVLLPMCSFDTPDEQRIRKNLVQECALMMPKPVRSLWRKPVQERLLETGPLGDWTLSSTS